MPTTPEPEPPCPDPAEPIDPTALIDDMEDGNPFILAIGNRNGIWRVAADPTPDATIHPAPDTEALPETIPGGRCGSQLAMHITGQGFTDWGARLEFTFVQSESGAQPYPVQGRTGLTFWARLAAESAAPLRVAINDRNSDPAGGVCAENGPVGETCHDTFGALITPLDGAWRRYRVPFVGLNQRGFGVAAQGVDVTGVYTVQFSFEGGAAFDFWVDDVGFY